ncbi:MAG: alpha/beta hydrolase [Candidatus Hodarchaeales archaeon]|jgi:dienelactone hydrolase
MKHRKLDKLTLVLLSSGLILVLSSVILGSTAFDNVHVEKITLQNKGVFLSALLLYPNDPQNHPRPAILAYHGWGGTKESVLASCLDYAKTGFVVLIPDLRGHGESGGVSTLGLVEQSDAGIAIDYLVSRSELVNASALSVLGSSFGGLISLLAAGNDPRIKATVSSSAPTNTTAWLRERDFRWNERLSYRPYSRIDPENTSAVEERSPMTYVNNIENLLVMHGDQDALVPVHHAYDLIQASNSSNKQLIIFSNQGHNLDGKRVKRETIQFLKDVHANPYIKVIGTSSFELLMSSWITLLIGGLLTTLGILSIFPTILQLTSNRWNLIKTPSYSLDQPSLITLILLITTFVIVHIGSAIISLEIITYHSTFLGLTLSTLVTIGLLAIGSMMIQKFQLSLPSMEQFKKWTLEIGLTLGMTFGLYFGWMIVANHPWIPFINLESVFRLAGILLTICIVLSLDAFFYWGLIHRFVTKLDKNQNSMTYLSRMSLIYVVTKCCIFFSLITLWQLMELRLIIYGILIFGLIGVISAIIRHKWGFSPTLIFSILAGLTAYSALSIFFLLL